MHHRRDRISVSGEAHDRVAGNLREKRTQNSGNNSIAHQLATDNTRSNRTTPTFFVVLSAFVWLIFSGMSLYLVMLTSFFTERSTLPFQEKPRAKKHVDTKQDFRPDESLMLLGDNPNDLMRNLSRNFLHSLDVDEGLVVNEKEKCGIYLAPSSIPDAGLGVFVTRPMKKKSKVFTKPDGPSVVVTDPIVNQKNEMRPEWARSLFLWPVPQSNPHQESDYALETIPNIGSMCNFHPYLHNINLSPSPGDDYDDSLLSRFKDPGSGAFSYHMGKRWSASRDVKSGEEIFCDYGEDWFLTWLRRWGVETRNFPFFKDYVEAGAVVQRMVAHSKTNGKVVDESTLSTTRNFVSLNNTRVASLLPKTLKEYVTITSSNSGEKQLSLELARNSVLQRSVKWIKANGHCLDNIVPGRSTLPQAGQGAFARRPLPKGSMVVPVPLLLQIPDKRTLDIYAFKPNTKEGRMKVAGDPIGKQLLVNYCFGNDKSSLLLCPGSNANLINHCSNRTTNFGQCGTNGPNAEIRWASGWDQETPKWLTKSLAEIRDEVANGRRGLSFEVVAIRSISSGEEIFIDYGVEWEEAWENHLASWRPPKDGTHSASFGSVTNMNRKKIPVRTEAELEGNPYPRNVLTICRLDRGHYHPCSVLEREKEDRSRLTVRVTPLNSKSIILLNFPRDRITFDVVPYSSDQHLSGAFRKSIGVRDVLWPDQWKDLEGKK